MSIINEQAYYYSDFLNEHNMNADSSSINNLVVHSDLTLGYVNANSILITDINKKVISKGLLDGQLLIGSKSTEPVAGFITGTPHQVDVTNGPGSITISLPQDIDITSSPNFDGLEITNNIIVGGLVDGVDISVFKADYDSKIDQGVKMTDSPSFNNLTVNNIDCGSIISTGDIKSNTNIVGNQLIGLGLTSNRLVGVGTNGLLQSLTATSGNGVSTTVSGTSLTINTPQDLRTTATPKFYALETDLYITSPIVGSEEVHIDRIISLGLNMITGMYPGYIAIGDPFGGNGGNVWMNFIKPGIDHTMYTYTVPNCGADASFVMTVSNQTIGGNKTFSNNVNINGTTTTNLIIPSADKTYDIGSTSRRWRNLYMADGDGSILLGVGSDGQASLNLYSADSATEHINLGLKNGGSKWHLSSRPTNQNDELRLYRGPGLAGTGTYEQLLTFTGSGANQRRITFNRTEDSSTTTNGSVVFNGGVGIAKTLNVKDIGCNTINASVIDTSTLNIAGSPINLSNLVTTNTDQSISGVKTFTANRVLIGSHNHGELRLSTYAGGDSRIHGGYVTDAEYYLEFYCRGVMIARMSNGYPGSGRDKWFDIYGSLRFPNGGGSFLNYYQEYTHSSAFWGTSDTYPYATADPWIPATTKIIRIGRQVTIDVSPSSTPFKVTSGSPYMRTVDPIPQQFRPPTTKWNLCAIRHNSVVEAGRIMIRSDGHIIITRIGHMSIGIIDYVNNLFPATITYNIN